MNKPQIQKKQPQKDWHVADIKAALEKKGWSLGRLSRAHGYYRTAAPNALQKRWPALERIIATAIGVNPQEIWPSRYAADHITAEQRTTKKGEAA